MAKIGEGHLQAMGRLGLKELRNAATPSKEGVADNEIGVFGTQTQGEIAQARGGAGSGPEQESPKVSLAEMKEAGKAQAQAQEQLKAQEQSKEQQRGQER